MMNSRIFLNHLHLHLYLSILMMSSLAAADNTVVDDSRNDTSTNADFEVNVFYPANVGIDSMLQSSVSSVASPDFEFHYKPVEISTWNNTNNLAKYLILTQKSSPADGFFLACKNADLDEISDQFRSTFPKVPFVDSFAPSLFAANIVSYRYVVLTGTENSKVLVNDLIEELGIENHLRFGASNFTRDSFLVKMVPYELTTKKNVAVQDIVSLGNATTGSHNLDLVVLNTEAIALVGCEGFLDVGVAEESESQLTKQNPSIPLQVINPIKASIGLLDSMIRNKVWISVPSAYDVYRNNSEKNPLGE